MAKANENDDLQSKVILCEKNMHHIVIVVKKFENAMISIEDLISIGIIGLIKAINSLTQMERVDLNTYVPQCIEKEVSDFLRGLHKA